MVRRIGFGCAIYAHPSPWPQSRTEMARFISFHFRLPAQPTMCFAPQRTEIDEEPGQ
jgi:hypothetical protein